MAEELKDVLAQFVPQKDLDEAIEALKDTDISPEWFRAEAAKLGADAKEAQELRARLAAIESAPKRKEALSKVGVDLDAVPKYGQDWLEQNIPADKLEDQEFIAAKVSEGGFQPTKPAEQKREPQAVDQINAFLQSAGQTSSTPSGVDPREEVRRLMDKAKAEGKDPQEALLARVQQEGVGIHIHGEGSLDGL